MHWVFLGKLLPPRAKVGLDGLHFKIGFRTIIMAQYVEIH